MTSASSGANAGASAADPADEVPARRFLRDPRGRRAALGLIFVVGVFVIVPVVAMLLAGS
jgi:hypothetical protein